MKPIRAELRLKNNRLIRLREMRSLSQKDAALAIGVQIGLYGNLERMTVSGRCSGGRGWRPSVLKVAEFYHVTPEYLFPEEIERIDEVRFSREVGFEELGAGEVVAQIGPAEEYDYAESKKELENLLSTLNKREQYILRRRCGFDGDCGTLVEVAEELGLSRERTRKIEYLALKKLREMMGDPNAIGDRFFSMIETMEACR